MRPAVARYPAWDLAPSLAAIPGEAWARQELIGALRPYLVLDRSLHRQWRAELDPEAGAKIEGLTLAEIAEAEVVFADEDHVVELSDAINRTEGPDEFWASQLEMLTTQLRQVLELFAVAGEANLEIDPSAFERPSIVPHEQNRHHRMWARLFDLIWRGWIHLDATDAEASRIRIWAWRRIPFLSFQRLVLAALRQSPHLTAEEKLEALLDG